MAIRYRVNCPTEIPCMSSKKVQIIPIAKTKNVKTNGRINVSQGQCVAMASTVSATATKNKIRYNPLFLFCISIRKNFGKNRLRGGTAKDIFYNSPTSLFHKKALLTFAVV